MHSLDIPLFVSIPAIDQAKPSKSDPKPRDVMATIGLLLSLQASVRGDRPHVPQVSRSNERRTCGRPRRVRTVVSPLGGG